MSKRKIFNICLTAAISICFILLGIFVFNKSYLRVFESLGDLWQSVKFYISEIFGIAHNTVPTVEGYSEVLRFELLPPDFENFKVKAADYFSLLFSGENFIAWGKSVGTAIGRIAKVLAILLPCLLLLFFAVKRLYASGNTKHNKDTLPLKVFKRAMSVTYQPMKKSVKAYIAFLKEYRWIWIVWAALWAFHLNLVTIAVEFLAYYLYFSVSYRFETLYVQFAKLIIDLQIIFGKFPWWLIVLAAYPLFERFRRRIALGRLRHYEARNCGFINELPIVSITCGSMGKKKTTMVTDMTLSQEVMFRQKALTILQSTDMKFPYFSWICFEKELQKCMEFGTVYNLATVKEWIKKKRIRFLKHRNTDTQLYGYDYRRYGASYDDALKISTLFEVLETYALSYFIYVIESSLIVANYSIRTDNKLIDEGNFPIWAFNFFPKKQPKKSRHAHILDFDILRLGKKVLENNPNAGSFEFGVVAITEIGKERGNNLELKEVKKKNEETNQKNDLFNSWLKMCRHSATVDNYPFIKVFTDEQRPESWGADARDLCEIVNIASSGDTKLSLPFYTIEDMISEWAFNRFISLYYDFRFRRGDNTLLVYLLKSVTSWLWRRNIRVYNRYGYSVLKIEKERGTMDGKLQNKRYYLMNQKIYSRRFSTDCFSDYFNDMAKNSKVGLKDYVEYVTEKATVDELKMQNSYFINGLYKDADSDGSA